MLFGDRCSRAALHGMVATNYAVTQEAPGPQRASLYTHHFARPSSSVTESGDYYAILSRIQYPDVLTPFSRKLGAQLGAAAYVGSKSAISGDYYCERMHFSAWNEGRHSTAPGLNKSLVLERRDG